MDELLRKVKNDKELISVLTELYQLNKKDPESAQRVIEKVTKIISNFNSEKIQHGRIDCD